MCLKKQQKNFSKKTIKNSLKKVFEKKKINRRMLANVSFRIENALKIIENKS